jgi:FAD/FMN-containing dehydrogenase
MLLRAGLGATAALVSATKDTAARSCDGLHVNGSLSYDEDIRAAAAHDFGAILHRAPRAVLTPVSPDDIVSLMRWAADHGVRVAARGQGHSTYGRAQAEDGIVIDMSALSTIHQIRPDRIVVDAGATWNSVFEATLGRGLTPPVLTNYLGLSVGGTIVVGGIGGSSSRHGMQTDHVLELDVVTGDGRAVTCSPDSEPELFDAVRGGLAQCALIMRATLRLMPAPQRVRRFQLFYPDLPSLTADQQRALSEDRFDQLQGAILPDPAGGWKYLLEGAVLYSGDKAPDDKTVLGSLSDDRSIAVVTDSDYRQDALAFARLEATLRSRGLWSSPQPWLFTFLPAPSAERVAGEILGGLSGRELGPFGRIAFYPIRTDAVRTPLVRLPDADIAFPLNVVRIGASTDAQTTDRMTAQNRMIYDRIRSAGGVQYPVSALPMSSEDWQDHFGARWPQLRAAKRRYDPANLLTPGYNLF